MDNNKTNSNGSEPPLCQKGCGFYGNPNTKGLCSSCYQKEYKSESISIVRPSSSAMSIGGGMSSVGSAGSSNSGSFVGSPMSGTKGGLSRQNINYENMLDYADEILKTSPRPGSFMGSGSVPKSTSGSIPIPIPGGNNNNNNNNLLTPTGSSAPGSFQQFTPGTTPTTPTGSLTGSPNREVVKCKFPECNKSIGLMAMTSNKCRCGEMFCGKHIHNHNCTFDYKAMAKNSIAKANPQVMGNKIVKL